MSVPLSLLILTVIYFSSTANALTMSSIPHFAKVDISPYVFGRNMKVNPCYYAISDPKTTFSFKSNQLTITSCNTHACTYSLDGLSFALGSCSQVTKNDCPQDPANNYIKIFKETTGLVLLANIITFTNSKGATIQLSDIK